MTTLKARNISKWFSEFTKPYNAKYLIALEGLSPELRPLLLNIANDVYDIDPVNRVNCVAGHFFNLNGSQISELLDIIKQAIVASMQQAYQDLQNFQLGDAEYRKVLANYLKLHHRAIKCFYFYDLLGTDHVLVSRTVNLNNLWETTNVQNTKLSIGI